MEVMRANKHGDERQRGDKRQLTTCDIVGRHNRPPRAPGENSMIKPIRTMLTAATLAVVAIALPAQAQNRARVGVLTCNVDSGWGLIFGSTKGLKCNYEGVGGAVERYSGSIQKYGVDIGYSGNGVIV
jgi:hypothetical protein